MSEKGVEWAWEQCPKTRSERLVLITLGFHADAETGSCSLTMPLLAKQAICSKRQAIRVVKSLEKQGFISVTKVHGESYHYEILTSERGDYQPPGF